MAIDVRRVGLAAFAAALEDAHPPANQRRKQLSGGGALLPGAAIVTGSRLLIGSRSQELINQLQQRLNLGALDRTELSQDELEDDSPQGSDEEELEEDEERVSGTEQEDPEAENQEELQDNEPEEKPQRSRRRTKTRGHAE